MKRLQNARRFVPNPPTPLFHACPDVLCHPFRPQELKELSQRSGGRERIELASVWDAPRPVTARGIRGWLLTLFIALLLAEALLTRLGVALVAARRANS